MKNVTLITLALAAAVAATLVVAPLSAHHSHAMFNGDVETEITGTLTSVRFVNPHVYLRVEATQRDGKPLPEKQTWAIEMSTTANMIQRGITPEILKVGVPISVKVNPLFSGGFSGNYTNLVMLDGKKNSGNAQDWKPAQ